MDLPILVTILGMDYEIIPSSEATMECAGMCLPHSGKIYLNTEVQSEEHLAFTLIHEILEAITHRLELDLEHSTITALEIALTQTLISNDDLLEYLAKRKFKDVGHA